MKQDDLLALMRGDTEDTTRTKAPSDVVALGEEMANLKEEIDALSEKKKELTERYDEIRNVQLPEAMAQAGLVTDNGQGKFSLSDGSTIYLQTGVYAYVRKADQGAFHAWLRSQGHSDLIKETVHPQTLKAFVREQIENGENLPEFVNQHHETSARIRRGR